MGLRVRDHRDGPAHANRETHGPASMGHTPVRVRAVHHAAERTSFTPPDRFEAGVPALLHIGADAGAPLRHTQALDFLRRAEALSLTLEQGGGRIELQAFAAGLAGRVANAPGVPTQVFDRILAQAAQWRDVDLEVLRRYLELLQRLLDDDVPLHGFLEYASAAAAGVASGRLGGVNGFLDGLVSQTSLAFTAEVAQFYASISAAYEGQQIAISVQATTVTISITQETETGDPLVLDLDGDGIELTSVDAGRRFDLDGDGTQDRTAFVAGGDGFLALDRNGNGSIDSGRELFGDQHGAAHGFAELARFDENGDGSIDARDSVFDQLRVLGDFDGDGVVGDRETRSLAELGIASIGLDARDVREAASGDNALAQRGTFTRTDGTRGDAADALLRYRRG